MCLDRPAPPGPPRRERSAPRGESRGRQPRQGPSSAHLFLSLSLLRAVKGQSVQQDPDHAAPRAAGVRGTGPSQWAAAAPSPRRTPRRTPAPRPRPGPAPRLPRRAPRCLGIQASPPARPQAYSPLRARIYSPLSPIFPPAQISDGTAARPRSASAGLTRAQIPSPRATPPGSPPASPEHLARTSCLPLPALSSHHLLPRIRYPQGASSVAAWSSRGPPGNEGTASGERDPPVLSTSGGPSPGTTREPFLIWHAASGLPLPLTYSRGPMSSSDVSRSRALQGRRSIAVGVPKLPASAASGCPAPHPLRAPSLI